MLAAQKKYLEIFINEIALQGKALIEKAYENRDFTNRTYNLHDSYGSAVYYNGQLLTNTIYTMTPQATQARKWYGTPINGKDEIFDFLNSYSAYGKGLELIIVAAMPYAEILEHGGGMLKHKYKVISGAYTDAEKLASKYKGIVKKL